MPRLSKFNRGQFRAFDGEGCELPSGLGLTHEPQYLLLACSDGTHIYREQGLDTAECLEYLLSKRDRDSINIMYGLSYDANMMLRDLSKKELTQVWENKNFSGTPVLNGRYTIKYIPRKMFRVSDRQGRSITLWDVVGYFQSTFIEALEEWLPDYDRLQLIVEGKQERGTTLFDKGLDHVLSYTRAELGGLVQLMERVRDSLATAGLPVKRWDGAGSIASAMLGKHYQRVPLPASIASTAYHAYYGGRAETFGVGTLRGPLYQYDIRSAYPAAMAVLPVLAGRWRLTDRFVPGKIGLYKVTWSCTDNICPFPHRGRDRMLTYPQQGTAWQWSPEIEAALDHGVKVRVHEGLALECDYSSRAFAFVPEMYQRRQEWRRQGEPAQAVLKLGLNSLYGKLAQSIGYDPKTGRLPPYHNPVYAGLITSITRATVYRAMMQSPNAIAYAATDGIVSSVPLTLEVGPGLGQWELTEIDEMKVVQSGVYCWKVGEWGYHYRGLDDGSLTVELLDSAWKRGEMTLTLPHTRFVGMGIALVLKEFNAWRRFITSTKTLNISGYAEYKREIWESTDGLHQRWVPSHPLPDAGAGIGYVPKWGTGSQWAAAVRRGSDQAELIAKLEEMEET